MGLVMLLFVSGYGKSENCCLDSKGHMLALNYLRPMPGFYLELSFGLSDGRTVWPILHRMISHYTFCLWITP